MKDGGPAFLPKRVPVKDMKIGDDLVCSKCGEFVKLSKNMKKIESRICPACASESAKVWAKRNWRRKLDNNNRYLKSLPPEQRSKYSKLYRARYPEKRRAHNLVQTALRNGSLIKQPCVVCGDTKAHAHHEDYSKPLDVIWMCQTHHIEHHQLKAREQ